MAKTPKSKIPAKPTPGKKAYAVACEAIGEKYTEFLDGDSDDADFTTPGKQKKVAKQLAKLHNRLLKKCADAGIEPLDEE